MPVRVPGAALCVLVLGCLLSGCGSRTTPVEEGNREQILHLGNQVEPSDLDPQVTTTVSEIKIHMALFEGLVSPDSVDLKPEPGVAERWETSEDGLTYTFYLREDAKWSNGDPVTAEDFVFSVWRILNPALGAPNASMLYLLENAEAFNQGRIDDFEQVGIRAIDSRTLEMKLKAPTPYFLSLLMHPAWYPVHRATIEKHGAEERRGTGWTQPGNHVGNGPFRLKTWKVNEVIAVEKNPYYWDAGKVKLKGIRFYPMEDLNTENLAFQAGQLHVTASVPSALLADYIASGSPYLRTDPNLGTEYYLLNVNRAPLDDVRVRHALNLSIDRASICRNVKKGGQPPAYNFTPPGTAGYEAKAKIEEDVGKARQLLKEAGYPDGKGFPALELLYNTSENNKAVAEAIQEMWRKNLGIEVNIFNQEYKVYLKSRNEQDYAIARSSWVGDYNDPNTFLGLWSSDSGNNHSGWANPEYDALIDQAAATNDPAKRNDLFQQAEGILLDDLPIIPLYFYVSAYLIRPEVKNWHGNILDWHPYKYVYLAPRE